MVIKTMKGMYEVLKNIRDAYSEEKFNEAYLEEYFDSYEYIVGDIASDTLRLKGFSINPNNDAYFKKIPDYINESCAWKGAYFILRRITSEDEYDNLYKKYKENPNKYVTEGDYVVASIEKVAYDKDALKLESNPSEGKNIILDMNKINKVKTFPLPDDLREEADEMKARDLRNASRGFNKNNGQRNNNQRPNKESQKPNNNQNQGKNNQNQNQNKNNSSNQQKPNNANQQRGANGGNNKKPFSNSNGNKKAFSNNR